jgi:PAS domain S-box-containing protein
VGEDQEAGSAFDRADWWQSESVRFVALAVLGTAASYVSVNIPYTDVYIEGRWIFGTMGFALLNHWWTALLLACILSIVRFKKVSIWTAFFGNMLYALPSLIFIRLIHKRVLDRLCSPVGYGVAWLLMILFGYQLFTPVVWVFMAFLEDASVWTAAFKALREQPFLVESLLVGVISALAMTVVRSNDALRASRRELATTLYSIGDGVIATDAEGRIERMNPVAERLTGWCEAEAIGEPLEAVLRVLDEETREPVEVSVIRMLNVGDASGLDGPMLLIARDGTERVIADSVAPIRDEHSIASGVVLVFRDQTYERAVQRALQESHEQMAQILTTVPDGVLLLNAEGEILRANPTAEEALAVLTGAEVGGVLTQLGQRPLAEFLTSSPPEDLWHEIKRPGHTFEVIARPVDRDSEPGHWVLVIRDVTRERELQMQLQQQERLAAVGQLAAGIAHDFNNIIATIVLYARMLGRTEDLSARDRERTAIISQQAWHASQLIEQILDFSRRAALKQQPLDLLSLLKEHIKLLRRTLPEHIAIDLTYDVGQYIVDADPTRMQQMLTNLAVNARDAMPEGGALRFALARVAAVPDGGDAPDETDLLDGREPGGGQDGEAEGWVRLTVSDTGTGIAPDVLPHIFEPFFTTKGPGGGSGLGLAQVYGIVKHHGGHLEVATTVGEGTTFSIYLPALRTQQPEALAVESQAFVQGQGDTILVVEDDVTLRRALVESLALLNYRVLEAVNGREALEILEQSSVGSGEGGQIDLVLSDLVMPEMGGRALFHAMRQRGLRVPMVILSGHPMASELDDLRDRGLAGWILKPPDMARLSQILAETLAQTVK